MSKKNGYGYYFCQGLVNETEKARLIYFGEWMVDGDYEDVKLWMPKSVSRYYEGAGGIHPPIVWVLRKILEEKSPHIHHYELTLGPGLIKALREKGLNTMIKISKKRMDDEEAKMDAAQERDLRELGEI